MRPNLIAVGGQRTGMSDEAGAANCVAFSNRVKAHAEGENATIRMEAMDSQFSDPLRAASTRFAITWR